MLNVLQVGVHLYKHHDYFRVWMHLPTFTEVKTARIQCVISSAFLFLIGTLLVCHSIIEESSDC